MRALVIVALLLALAALYAATDGRDTLPVDTPLEQS